MGTILIVDDELGIREMLDHVLTEAGYRVLTAINGREGLERLSASKPDLVLLDFMMPVMDGPTMCRARRTDCGLRSIPIIMMSSFPEAAVVKECNGYIAFLQKPFRVQEAVEIVTRVLAGRSPEEHDAP